MAGAETRSVSVTDYRQTGAASWKVADQLTDGTDCGTSWADERDEKLTSTDLYY